MRMGRTFTKSTQICRPVGEMSAPPREDVGVGVVECSLNSALPSEFKSSAYTKAR